MRETMDNVNHSEDVLELVHAVMHAVRAHQHQELRGMSDLTPLEARVLRFFGRHPGATQSDLAEHSGRDKAQLARLIKGLRERGLLEAQADEADRRHLRLVLSADGQAWWKRLRQLHRRLATQAVAGFDEKETAQLAALLRRLDGNLRGN